MKLKDIHSKLAILNTLFLILSLLFSLTLLNTEENTFSKKLPLYERAFIASCPEPNERNKEVVENFLTKSYWATEREETGTTMLSASQISVLTDVAIAIPALLLMILTRKHWKKRIALENRPIM